MSKIFEAYFATVICADVFPDVAAIAKDAAKNASANLGRNINRKADNNLADEKADSEWLDMWANCVGVTLAYENPTDRALKVFSSYGIKG